MFLESYCYNDDEMNYKDHIEKALTYIEENLKNDIDLSMVAKVSGYSNYHFLRVFKEVTHLTPADYIRKRRLTEIVREMGRSERPISDIAFEYGFNSKENFTRAFRSEHHILPTEYKRAGNSLKLYDRFKLETESLSVTPDIVNLPSFSLTVYPSDEDYPPNFWNKYNCRKLSKKLSGGAICEDFGACIWNHETQKLDYYIGIRTDEAFGDLSGTINIVIPGGLYAIFKTPPATHFNFVNTIHATWDYINTIWLPKSEYTRTGGYELESYIEASRCFSEKIYIPIMRRSG